MSAIGRVVVAAVFLACSTAGVVHAGRPLSTEDAGVLEVKQCQIESWVQGSPGDRQLIFAPACALTEGLELDLEFVRSRPSNGITLGAGIALKWVPSDATVTTPLGALDFGVKAGLSGLVKSGGHYGNDALNVIGIASLKMNPELTLHANVGAVRQVSASTSASTVGFALSWSPSSQVLLFAEHARNSRPAVFGASTNTVGLRWWLVPEKLGLDFTVLPKSNGQSVWTTGFGWYGLGL